MAILRSDTDKPPGKHGFADLKPAPTERGGAGAEGRT